MKNNFLKLFFCLICIFPNVTILSQIDAKYLTGAVPEVNGKVVFSDTLVLPGTTQKKVYEIATIWAKANFNTTDNRIVYTSDNDGIISCKGYSELIFSSSALSLDKAFMNFQLTLFCSDNACRVEMKSISYDYNVSTKNTPEKYRAETWITDKQAVNKNKLYRMNGKFRIKTVDQFDDICNSLNLSLHTTEADLFTDKNKSKLYDRKNSRREALVLTAAAVSTQILPATAKLVVPQTAIVSQPDSQQMNGFKNVNPETIPGNIIKMLTNDWMLITAGNGSKFNMMTASWGGLGVLFGKPVAYCFINPARHTYQLMESGNTYSFSFYTEAYREALKYCGANSGKDLDKVKNSGLTPITLPSGCNAFQEAWLIIECQKLYSQPMNAEGIQDEKIKGEYLTKASPKMYIGEILNVWIK